MTLTGVHYCRRCGVFLGVSGLDTTLYTLYHRVFRCRGR